MKKKHKRIIRRWLALVLITALIGQTVSMRFFDTAYAAGTEQIVSESGTELSAEQFTETDFSRPVTVLGAEAVNKSYPHFWDDLEKLKMKREK